MKKIGYTIAIIVAIYIGFNLVTSYMDAPERVADIITHWSLTWFKGGIISAIVCGIIFFINRKVSNERNMSILGMVVFAPLIPLLLYLFFGYHTWLFWMGIGTGLIVGWFTYIIDDHLLDIWEVRHISIPIIFGLGFGGSVIVACITETWQDEEMFVTEHSVCTEVSVERYTSHYHSTKHGGYYTYSWDHYTSHYFFKKGDVYPTPVPPTDFTLGSGVFGKEDRYSYIHRAWIGGYKILSWRDQEKNGKKYLFKWIYNSDPEHIQTKLSTLYDVDENYFGHAKLAKVIDNGLYTEKDFDVTSQNLPTEKSIPGAFGMFFDFFGILFSNPDFSILRCIYLLLYLPFLIAMIFVQELRISFWIFLASSTIIILIILAIAVAKSGESLSDMGISRKFGGFGGGSFGGAGAGSRW